MRKLIRWLLQGLLIVGLSTSPGMCIAGRIMESQDREAYSRYRTEADRLNFEREKTGLAPQHVMTFEEWKGEKK
jgi:hypothetical protein